MFFAFFLLLIIITKSVICFLKIIGHMVILTLLLRCAKFLDFPFRLGSSHNYILSKKVYPTIQERTTQKFTWIEYEN